MPAGAAWRFLAEPARAPAGVEDRHTRNRQAERARHLDGHGRLGRNRRPVGQSLRRPCIIRNQKGSSQNEEG